MSFLERLARRDEDARAVGRHGLLLLSLIFLLVSLPILRFLPGGGLRFSILFYIVLSAAVYANSTERWTLVVTALAAVGALASGTTAQATGSMTAQIVSDALGFGLLGFTTFFILNTLVHTQRVSRDTVVGGVCVYLLIGLFFAMGYILVIDLGLGALHEGGAAISRMSSDVSSFRSTVLYFSLVTLTTLGYGDVTPVGEMTRMMASIEALIGQLFVAIFIARLIAMRGDHSNATP